jgi:hypothetical protein
MLHRDHKHCCPCPGSSPWIEAGSILGAAVGYAAYLFFNRCHKDVCPPPAPTGHPEFEPDLEAFGMSKASFVLDPPVAPDTVKAILTFAVDGGAESAPLEQPRASGTTATFDLGSIADNATVAVKVQDVDHADNKSAFLEMSFTVTDVTPPPMPTGAPVFAPDTP